MLSYIMLEYKIIVRVCRLGAEEIINDSPFFDCNNTPKIFIFRLNQ